MQPWQYIVLLGAVIAVLAFAMPRRQTTNKQAESSEQIEHVLEHYFMQAEQDHESLVQLVKETQQNSRSQVASNEQKVKQLEEQLLQLSRQLERQELVKVQQGSIEKGPEQDIVEQMQVTNESPEEQATTIQHRYKQLLQLYHGGKSIDMIAKQMQLNKGEVQLIIQLARQEEKHRA
ncbi:DUF6115 domain-containing protein [Paenibacillus yanchengensis]|uniref:DUF6115 domain-containing protein n=1 Tax=Paenibacillus yanchengensis TaxID=2035833 RepID=A0ABW4YMD9_9BACL